MPIPEPNEREPEDTFIKRCMSDETMKQEFPDKKQRYAICLGKWRKLR